MSTAFRWRALAVAEAEVSGCSAGALKNATFGVAEQVQCADASGYSLSFIVAVPTAEEVSKMCSVDGCRKAIRAMAVAAPDECTVAISSTGSELLLYRDVLSKIESACGFNAKNEDQVLPSGSSSSSASDRVAQTTMRATNGGSGLSVGAIVACVAAAIGCGLLAAFIATRLKRQRGELSRIRGRTQSTPDDPVATPHDDGDDYFSQRVYTDFAAVATASKVSSTNSRASTASSKHSHASGGDLSPRWMSQCAEVMEDPFDDPSILALRIPDEAFTVGECISRGRYADVYRGVYNSDQAVVVKRLALAAAQDTLAVNQLLTQASALSTLQHERILQVIGVAWDTPSSQVSVVMKHATGGDLRCLLNRYASDKRGTGFCPDKVKIALHIAEAIHFLHSQDPTYLHRDLTSSHVLLSEELDVVLAGIGSLHPTCDASTSGSLWTAPEVLQGDAYTSQADIFSFGVLLSELDTHRLPYSDVMEVTDGEDAGVSETEILHKVALGYLSVSFSDKADADLVSLGRACLALDPRERPTAADVLHRVGQVERTYGAFV